MQHVFSLLTSRIFWLGLILVGGAWRYFGDAGSTDVVPMVTTTTPPQTGTSVIPISDLSIDDGSITSTVSDDSLLSLMDDVGNTSILSMLRSASDKEQTLTTYIQQIDALTTQAGNLVTQAQSTLMTLQSQQSTCTSEQNIALGSLDKTTDTETKQTLLLQAQQAAACSASASVAITYHTTQSTTMTKRLNALTAKKNLITTNRSLLIQYTSELAGPIPAQLVDLQKTLTTQ